MSYQQRIANKIYTADEAVKKVAQWRMTGSRIVFTNGCFDLLHQGHVIYLGDAADMGDRLIIGINSDESVKRLKGESRPVKDQDSRALVLASLVYTDAVVIFNEDTPMELIKALQPDVLVKGGDWPEDQIVGADLVKANGGEVKTIPFVEGHSTTGLIDRMKEE